MLDKERLIEKEVTEEIAEDDYILIDSPTLGTRKILASKFEPAD